jgi:hypothetical protein
VRLRGREQGSLVVGVGEGGNIFSTLGPFPSLSVHAVRLHLFNPFYLSPFHHFTLYMYMRHGQAACSCTVFMLHDHAACTIHMPRGQRSMVMQHRHACSSSMPMHISVAITCSTDMHELQHGMQPRYSAWTSMAMQHEYACTCSMNMQKGCNGRSV